MSRDISQEKDKAKVDINWKVLIEHSESQIKHLQERLKAIRKSLSYFRKQEDCDVPFPTGKYGRHKELS
jgi:hypothetical protein